MIKPGPRLDGTAARETASRRACIARSSSTSASTPSRPGVFCEYYLAEYLAGEAVNCDDLENIDAMWVPIASMHRFVPANTLYPPIPTVLKEQK